ncbi:hypothetical protein KKG22_04360 [Patescibacteria group bacterium]|nr:hypothetical protein [Patescibacteria group bacterium]MBU1721411.1 hypothetical protein [Patescibacteria group bacterium]MBU1901851.1 hypothetical protein [Patescibacteria group bacterium]
MEKNNDKLGQKVLDTIQQKQVKPLPKVWFLGKESFWWGGVTVSILAAFASMAVFVFILFSQDWDIGSELGRGWIPFILRVFPFFWMLMIILLVYLIYISLRHTSSGYKYKTSMIILLSVIIIAGVGIGLHFLGGGQKTEEFAQRHMPVYGAIHQQRMQLWHQPERGFLAGSIVAIEGKHVCILEDLGKNIWHVQLKDVDKPIILHIGMQVKVRGIVGNEQWFFAESIRPFFPKRIMLNR